MGKQQDHIKFFQNLVDLCGVKSDINKHLMLLYMISMLKQPKVIVELGVRSGSSTQSFLSAVSNIEEAKLFSYDITPLRVPKWSKKFALLKRIPEAVNCDYWEFEIGNSLEVYKKWEDKSIDLLFIDTEHTAEHIYKELCLWADKVKDDGCILMHDVAQDGSDLIDGIKQFNSENTQYIYLSCECQNGLGIFFKEKIQ